MAGPAAAFARGRKGNLPRSLPVSRPMPVPNQDRRDASNRTPRAVTIGSAAAVVLGLCCGAWIKPTSAETGLPRPPQLVCLNSTELAVFERAPQRYWWPSVRINWRARPQGSLRRRRTSSAANRAAPSRRESECPASERPRMLPSERTPDDAQPPRGRLSPRLRGVSRPNPRRLRMTICPEQAPRTRRLGTGRTIPG